MPFIDPLSSMLTASLPPRLPPNSPITENIAQITKFPSSPSSTPTTFPAGRDLNPFEAIALKAREVNKERTARKKAEREARERERIQSSGSGSGSSSQSTVVSSGESSSLTKGLYLSPASPALRLHASQGIPNSNGRQGIPTSSGHRMQSTLSSLTSPPHQIQQSNQHVFGNDRAVTKSANRDHPPSSLFDICHTGLTSGQEVTMEEEDDDADLKRLMNQAQAMLQISDNNPKVREALQRKSNGSDVSGIANEKDRVKLVGIIATVPNVERRQRAINYLESLFLGLLGDIERSTRILNDREIEGKIKSKAQKVNTGSKRRLDDGEEVSSDEEEVVDEGIRETQKGQIGITLKLKSRTTGEDQVITYPEDPSLKRESALHRITQRCRVAELLYEAVLTRCVTTKRDIYYKDVQLFKTQYVVDKIVDDIVATAGLKRQDFYVCAASKGLVASASMRIYLKTGDELSLSATNASLIPPIEKIEKIEAEGGVKWVLIVEKDAVFQTLLGLKLLEQAELPGGVIITGKGYPDLATLQLCKLISQTYPSASFHALVDADPHGIDIMQVYANGSKSTTHSHDHKGLALGQRLRWIGVKASEWLGLGVGYDQLLELSDKDVEKAMAMLKRRNLSIKCRRELQHMLHLNKKAEIQILSGIREDEVQSLESIYTDGGGMGEVRVPRLLSYVMERLVASDQ